MSYNNESDTEADLLPPVQHNLVKLLETVTATIVEIREKQFVAKTKEPHPELGWNTYSFVVEDVSPCDRHKIKLGSVFTYSVGLYDTHGGQRERISKIEFAPET